MRIRFYYHVQSKNEGGAAISGGNSAFFPHSLLIMNILWAIFSRKRDRRLKISIGLKATPCLCMIWALKSYLNKGGGAWQPKATRICPLCTCFWIFPEHFSHKIWSFSWKFARASSLLNFNEWVKLLKVLLIKGAGLENGILDEFVRYSNVCGILIQC